MLEQKIEELTAAVKALTNLLAQGQGVGATMPVTMTTAQPEEKATGHTAVVAAEASSQVLSGPSEQDVKDLTLARSREGHKDAIRDKLSELNAKKIGDLKGDGIAVFYEWLQSLGDK